MRLSAAIALGATAAVLAAGQDPAPASSSHRPATARSTFRTEANYVRVDVTRRSTAPRSLDLRQSDFEVVRRPRPAEGRDSSSASSSRGGAGQPGRPEPNTVEEVAPGRSGIRGRGCSCCSSTSNTSRATPRARSRRPLVKRAQQPDRSGRLRRRDDARHVRARHHVRAPPDVDRRRALARVVGRTGPGEFPAIRSRTITRLCYPARSQAVTGPTSE